MTAIRIPVGWYLAYSTGETMAQFTFLRTVQYTEVIKVDADTYSAAHQMASEADGERNHDDIPVDLKLVPRREHGDA